MRTRPVLPRRNGRLKGTTYYVCMIMISAVILLYYALLVVVSSQCTIFQLLYYSCSTGMLRTVSDHTQSTRHECKVQINIIYYSSITSSRIIILTTVESRVIKLKL